MHRRYLVAVALGVAALVTAKGDVPVYDCRAGGNFYSYPVSGVPKDFIEEQLLAPLANGRTYSAFLTSAQIGIVNLTDHAQSTDALLVWYDTVDLDGSSPSEPAFSNLAGGVWFASLSVPAGGTAYFDLDLAGDGRGVPLSNQFFGTASPRFFVPGTSLSVRTNGLTQLCSSQGTIGTSGDFFFSDDAPGANHDGVVEANETYNFGGSPNAANLYLAYTACIPCDANCDGSVNPFDIQRFLDVLAGQPGCSACAGDANVNGTANPFDINAFIDCLSKPLIMH